MRAAFAIAALAGAAIAAPSYGYGYNQPEKEVKNVHVVVETVVETVYVTEGYEPAAPTPAPEPVYDAPAQPTTTVVYEAPAQPETPYQPPAQPTPTPTPEAPKPSTPAPSNDGYMAVVDEYRQKMGLKALTKSSKLESNALDTVVASNGQMIHKLNPGTFGQVLAQGKPDEFKRVFVGGWLCELPNTPGLGNECQTMSQGWRYDGQTGHAEILTSAQYSEIGCAEASGVWCCDLA